MSIELEELPEENRFENIYRQGALDELTRLMEVQLRKSNTSVAWERLGHLQRVRGDLLAAAESFSNAVTADRPTEVAEELNRILNHKTCISPPSEDIAWPAPFTVVDGFMDDEFVQLLRDTVRQRHDKFQPDGVLRKKDPVPVVDKKIRDSVFIKAPEIKDKLIPKVTQMMQSRCEGMNTEPFSIERIEFKITVQEDGGHFLPHIDNGPNVADRVISYVYYFELEPREFNGGDFLLYDLYRMNELNALDIQSPEDVYGIGYTRICHRHNRLFLFPSHCLHEVVPVERTGWTQGAGRYAAVGHFWRKTD